MMYIISYNCLQPQWSGWLVAAVLCLCEALRRSITLYIDHDSTSSKQRSWLIIWIKYILFSHYIKLNSPTQPSWGMRLIIYIFSSQGICPIFPQFWNIPLVKNNSHSSSFFKMIIWLTFWVQHLLYNITRIYLDFHNTYIFLNHPCFVIFYHIN